MITHIVPLVPYLNSKDQPDKTFYQNKILLNQEFNKMARITNLVGILYYPTQVQYLPLPHAKLELEGKCYILCGDRNDRKSLERKIVSALRGNLSFARIGISVTPQQLKELKQNIHSIKSTTCSKGVSDALSKYANFRIPFPLSYGPTLSTSYLLVAKKMNCSRITSFNYYSSYNSRVDKTFKVGYPIFSLTVEVIILVGEIFFVARVVTILFGLVFD